MMLIGKPLTGTRTALKTLVGRLGQLLPWAGGRLLRWTALFGGRSAPWAG